MLLTENETNELKIAKIILEQPGIVNKLLDYFGEPVLNGISELPETTVNLINEYSDKAVLKAMDLAMMTINNVNPGGSNLKYFNLNNVLGFATGAVSAYIGPKAFTADIFITTFVILRTILEEAVRRKEDLDSSEGKLACLQVFILNGGNEKLPIKYYGLKSALSSEMEESSDYIKLYGVGEEGTETVKLVKSVADRFNRAVSDKLFIKSIPYVNAVSSGLINTLFIEHYRKLAKAHFTVRSLERNYGTTAIRSLYSEL